MPLCLSAGCLGCFHESAWIRWTRVTIIFDAVDHEPSAHPKQEKTEDEDEDEDEGCRLDCAPTSYYLLPSFRNGILRKSAPPTPVH